MSGVIKNGRRFNLWTYYDENGKYLGSEEYDYNGFIQDSYILNEFEMKLQNLKNKIIFGKLNI